MSVLLGNVIEDTNVSTNTTCQTLLQKLIKYKQNYNYKHSFIERLNDTVGIVYMCVVYKMSLLKVE
jgi:hypothetical protein